MRLVWVNDFDPMKKPFGGAEANMKKVIREAQEHHECVSYGIDPETHEFRAPKPDDIEGDFLILGNTNMLPIVWLMELIRKFEGRYIVWIHDAPWCGARASLCRGNVDPSHANCKIGMFWPIYHGALAVFAYSPRQAMLADEVFALQNIKILPIFCERPYEFAECAEMPAKRGSVCAVGRFSGGKGGRNLVMFAIRNPQFEIDVYGTGPKEIATELGRLDNVKLHGHVPMEELPKIYGKHQYFFHQPPHSDAGPRTIVEARLAGCELLVSSVCGYLTHPAWLMSNYDLAAHCDTAFVDAWGQFEEVLPC